MASAILSISIIAGGFFFSPAQVRAERNITATVSGTVASGTTSSILYLDTPQGQMIIKIDSDTDTSACRLMLPGSTVYAALYYGSDAYMHAASLSSSSSVTASSSSSSASTVTGTIMDKPMTDNIMYVSLSSGEMHVKLDATTTYSVSTPLYAGKSITMQVVRGNDAYMHAVNISDGTSGQTSQTNVTTYSSSGVATTAVTGTISSSTKADTGIVYLETKDGTYTLKLDSDTNYSNGFLLISGQRVTANIYRGSDAYMHAASFTRTGSQSAVSAGSATMSFSGTVASNTNESTLYLVTTGGTMTIRLDSNTAFTGTSPIFSGSKVTVSCTNCSDGYWHAGSIARS